MAYIYKIKDVSLQMIFLFEILLLFETVINEFSYTKTEKYEKDKRNITCGNCHFILNGC